VKSKPKPKSKAPYGTWSSGRPRGRYDVVTATLVDRLAAEQTVVALITAAGFVDAGQTLARAVITEFGVVNLPGRRRFENRNHVRVTIGRDTTLFYTVSDGETTPIAVLHTRDVDAVKQTLETL
jgi:hypothetical protein